MNARAWWVGITDEDDARFYRYHIIKSCDKIQWISDQQGNYSESPEERMIRLEEEAEQKTKELNGDIIPLLFQSISKLDREILRLRHEKGLKWQLISEVLGYNLSYLWKREKRAMEKMRAIIEREGYSPWR